MSMQMNNGYVTFGNGTTLSSCPDFCHVTNCLRKNQGQVNCIGSAAGWTQANYQAGGPGETGIINCYGGGNSYCFQDELQVTGSWQSGYIYQRTVRYYFNCNCNCNC